MEIRATITDERIRQIAEEVAADAVAAFDAKRRKVTRQDLEQRVAEALAWRNAAPDVKARREAILAEYEDAVAEATQRARRLLRETVDVKQEPVA